MRLRYFPDKEEFSSLMSQGNLVPVCCEILADTETPVSALAKIRRTGRPAFLLESVEGGERWGRYSFLGASASRHLRITRDRVEIEEGKDRRTIPHDGDPFPVVRDFMARYRPVSIPQLPRFWGGLVGVFDYEAVSFFERIPHSAPPDKPLIQLIETDELLIFDNVRHTLTLVVPVYSPDGAAAAPALYDQARDRLESLIERLETPAPVGAPPADFASVPRSLETVVPPADFMQKVERVKAYITAGDVIQTVLSQPFVMEPAPDPWFLYRAQRYVNPSPYMFFVELDERILVGSSPETMVRLENGVATLRPIAGTRPRGATEQDDRHLADELLQDPKERAEHMMLVDLGRNDLGRVAEVGTVQVTDLMVVERYSHVMHLVSNITCDLVRQADAWDLLRATFPAGTLTGAPKIRAMEIIAELEEAPRGAYGGAVGYVSFTGNMDLAITIRTACLERGRMTVQAGAGIVADSVPEREHEETVNKAKAIQRAVELLHGAARRNGGTL
ncbi:anthranilate synthase, component I [Desulfacinum hydrothermale DSM 13146]|uniref:Anthranilate synthase component 1 n=1 Tax=Desulfacinum hydrothermale DSM 13146 TaxID=1121390 RepID=A0A1W1XSB9_9BACT|nr:anthranilate synthase component I family protein [Desulfacinum hydrothermale]SMC26787.1 anthranilate synthase, component I [Desulfacinum hydrothermale DSM 13146]